MTNKMKIQNLRKLAGLGAIALLFTGGCAPSNSNKTIEEKVIRGIPVSVAPTADSEGCDAHLATVIYSNGKFVLCSRYAEYPKAVAEATALIQSEINDGDEEEIVLRGRYIGKKFEIYSIKAQGYEIELIKGEE